MKWSKYNFLHSTPKGICLLYNSLSNSLVEIDKKTFIFLNKFSYNEKVCIDDEKLQESLVSIKALVENEKDEFYSIKYAAHFGRFKNHILSLTINPTLHCNFNCVYCFEEAKPPIYMTEEVEDSIIDFIKKQHQLKAIRITWFGGEPLMAF